MALANVSPWNDNAGGSPTTASEDRSTAESERNAARIRQGGLPRSASYTHLPSRPDPASDDSENMSFERRLTDIFDPSADSPSSSSPEVTPRNTPQRRNSPPEPKAERRKSGAVPEITISKFASTAGRPKGETSYKGTSAKTAKNERIGAKHRSISDSFASFAKRSWTSSSRSPSPGSRDGGYGSHDESVSTTSISSTARKPMKLPRDPNRSIVGSSLDTPPMSLTRKGTALLRRSTKSPYQYSVKDVTESPSPNGQLTHRHPFPKSFSTDRLPSLTKTLTRKESWAPKSSLVDQQNGRSVEPPRKKDELWSVFRALESDYQKFDSKPSALKVNVIRSSLLPFLKNYSSHPSIRTLRPEDLDRRTTILDKWWNGLLDMLDGTSKTVAGTDRPALLESISGIMVRPEWRLPPSLSPPSESPAFRNIFKSKSSTSLDSSQSEFWVDSVHHNVRNLFIHNLQNQMAIIVKQMSLRSAPASLVSWSGKGIAYAFYFCPGVADTLIRLWGISPDTIRRVLHSLHISGLDMKPSTIDEIVSKFPSNLHSLRFSSFAATVRSLRRHSPLPLNLQRIHWDGPWTTRWCGRDSDLLFVFIKHWHILLGEFIPPSTDLIQKATSPAFVMVHAQILTVLDSTIHRQANQQVNPGGSAIESPTFDDVFENSESSVAALPPPPSNVSRLMAENRLIMLLRDFLSENSADFESARHTYAEVFPLLLRAATRRTSVFNHSACSTLCDLMEEVLFIFARYQRVEPSSKDFIDWAFWVDVCKEMAKSQNTLTETRLFTFLYSIWGIVACDEELKEKVCLGWLLTKPTFNNYFSHWCPMNRAIFMRLLCWRIARYDGPRSELDTRILQVVSDRLENVWLHFVHFTEEAESQKQMAPSTAPCNPAPGRRLIIIRNDNQVVPGSMFLSFDGILSPHLSQESGPKSLSTTLQDRQIEDLRTVVERPSTPIDTTPHQSDQDSIRKKRWTFFRSGRSAGTSGDESSSTARVIGSSTEVSSPGEQSGDSNLTKQAADPSNRTHDQKPKDTSEASQKQASQYTLHSFKFSLDLMERPYGLSKERRLSPPKLPMPMEDSSSNGTTQINSVQSDESQNQSNLRRTYAGRALAEWGLVIGEYRNFFERRRAEGVPSNSLVETPTLGLETFRST
ncbi:MAG: hypothetical protein M1837_003386 [Sclerophora amabilis]|nr:MAG: hypothetical protein M1837_003386 [Sclerophora amabilis]